MRGRNSIAAKTSMFMCHLFCVIDHHISTIQKYVQEIMLCNDVELTLHLCA